MANRRYGYNRDFDWDYDWEYGPDYYNQGSNQGYRNQSRYNQGNYNRTGYGSNRGYGYNRGTNQGYQGDYYDTDYDYDWDNGPTWTYYEYWWVPGPYEGMGPQDYQRSDEQICDDIHDRLTRHGQLDARNVHVDVNDGEVTLTGTVNSRREKRLAEDLADDVSGVTDVNNQLKINKQGQQRGGNKQSQRQKQISVGKIHTGMEVCGVNGNHAGTVKEIRDNDFLLDRDMDRDVYVPFSACKKIQDGKIFLNVTADQVDDQGWKEPQIMGMGS